MTFAARLGTLFLLGVPGLGLALECDRNGSGGAELLLGAELSTIVNVIDREVRGGVARVELAGMDSPIWSERLETARSWQRRVAGEAEDWFGCSDAAMLFVEAFGREIRVLVVDVRPENLVFKRAFLIERAVEAIRSFQREVLFPRLTFEMAQTQIHRRFADGVTLGFEAGRTEGLIYVEIPPVMGVSRGSGSEARSGFLRMRVELLGWTDVEGSDERVALHRMEATLFQTSNVTSENRAGVSGAGLFGRVGTVRIETRAESDLLGRSIGDTYRPDESETVVDLDFFELLLGRSRAFGARVSGFLQMGARLGVELLREGRERGARLSVGLSSSMGLILGGRFYLAVGGEWSRTLSRLIEGAVYGQVGVLTHDRIGFFSRVMYRIESTDERYPEDWSVTGGVSVRLQ